ncbi:MAG TPA: VOC family protein [Candidatus Thermoplasmatota archaeon]|nr:VOC family protein [Candidatus Thermoplasmatota archaeon]
MKYAGIRVTDLPRSLRFYCDGLGLAVEKQGSMSHGGQWALLHDVETGQRLELNFYPPGSPFARPYVAGEGLDHLGFEVDDARKWHDQLVRAFGAKSAMAPTHEPPDEIVAYVEDPDGNWIEFFSQHKHK